jgi:hypothetical protein
MKRLRKAYGSGIRFFHCGEYGELLQRPHYHACIFNFDFPDKQLFSERDGIRLYTSEVLNKLWSHPKTKESMGFCTIGDVTFESAAYVARYVLKKVNGKEKDAHYGGKCPEYVTMSRRPGIGKKWFEKFKNSVYPDDYIVIRNNVLCKPPKYYDSLYDLTEPEKCASIKEGRKLKASSCPDNQPDVFYDRLSDREKVQLAKAQILERNLE